jgi:hypothetical protein
MLVLLGRLLCNAAFASRLVQSDAELIAHISKSLDFPDEGKSTYLLVPILIRASGVQSAIAYVYPKTMVITC